MAEIINMINISANSFSDLKTYLDKKPEYLLFSSPSGAALKVDLEQQDESSSGKAKNSVIRWCEQIIEIVNNYYQKKIQMQMYILIQLNRYVKQLKLLQVVWNKM